MTKYLIFDSGALINFTSNSLLSVFEELKKIFPGEFLITKSVEREVITYPIKVKRFEWGALRVKQLLDRGVIKLPDKSLVNYDDLRKEAKAIMNEANDTFYAHGKAIHLIDEGEAESLALAKMLGLQNHETAIVIDERTARVLCEKPDNLKKLLEKKLHTGVKVNEEKITHFQKCNIIRSTELAYIAYKQGFIELKDKKTLEAVIYALKFGGCSISEKEVEMYKKMR